MEEGGGLKRCTGTRRRKRGAGGGREIDRKGDKTTLRDADGEKEMGNRRKEEGKEESEGKMNEERKGRGRSKGDARENSEGGREEKMQWNKEEKSRNWRRKRKR